MICTVLAFSTESWQGVGALHQLRDECHAKTLQVSTNMYDLKACVTCVAEGGV
jgi:hypothetical protein